MPLTEATKNNLRRKSGYVDAVQVNNGIPLWSWLELSLTELCNRSAGHQRACPFCPRIDPKFYPNQNLHMDMDLVRKIARELAALNYKGVVVLCGYGEPLLHPEIVEVVRTFKDYRVEIITNGDFLGNQRVEQLLAAGVDYFVVSLYDGPHQIPVKERLFAEAGCSTDMYILRDRWHSEEDKFGLKLTNRAGTVSIGVQDPVDSSRPCHYLAYQLMVDWNGDVLLCPQDWNKRVKYGNLGMETMFDVWSSPRMQKRRRQLIAGRRVDAPCNVCNTDGTLHGYNHVEQWARKK